MPKRRTCRNNFRNIHPPLHALLVHSNRFCSLTRITNCAKHIDDVRRRYRGESLFIMEILHKKKEEKDPRDDKGRGSLMRADMLAHVRRMKVSHASFAGILIVAEAVFGILKLFRY